MNKYQIVKSWLLNNIEVGNIRPGDKLPSESELMQQFSVSRNAVRQAVNLLIKDKYVESRRGIGTFCLKRSLSNSMLVGLISLRMTSYIFPKIIEGCSKALRRNGYELLIHQSHYNLEEEHKILEDLRNREVDGIIITPVSNNGAKTNAELLHSIEAQGIPVVLLDNEYKNERFSSIILNDYSAGYSAAEHLYNMGHRQIGVLYSKNYRPKVIRKDGVLNFLQEKNIPIKDEWLIGIEGQTSAIHTYRQIREIFKTGAPMPTAMICSSDDESLMFIYQAKKHGLKIPNDISIISFDNSDIAKYSDPRLTSMNHPSEYMGELAVSRLLEKIYRNDLSLNSRTVVDSLLIKRNSVLQCKIS